MSGEYSHEYYMANRDRMIASSRKYYAENKDKILAKAKVERELNPELTKMVYRLQYEKNREENVRRSNERNKRIRAEKKLEKERLCG